MPRVLPLAPALLVASLALAGCGSTTTDTGAVAPPTTTAAPAAPAGSAAGTASGTTTKVSANTASASEITAALTAAGVANAERWTDEIMEYRPYPADDPNLTALRDELAKYNPGAGVIDQIVAVLEP